MIMGKGKIFGEEEVLKKIPYKYTVVCKSLLGEIYSIREEVCFLFYDY